MGKFNDMQSQGRQDAENKTLRWKHLLCCSQYEDLHDLSTGNTYRAGNDKFRPRLSLQFQNQAQELEHIETGHICYVPFLRIWRGGKLVAS